MSVRIVEGRATDANNGEVVVFMIGMRIHRWRALRQWWPAFTAMPGMLKELAADPNSGVAGFRLMIGGGLREITLVQYWKDTDRLLAYAAAADQQHRPAWQAFNQRARASATRGHKPAMGIWHETYAVPAGRHETVYVNMPPYGLGQAFGTQPVAARGERAAQRLGQAEDR
ncbi:hypothetical protein ABIA33_005125 [Streptacidiphilus sp. MAP12-16]|jgi:hypothetical protein|uniref:DUF4188 domain-containing protein n=1 Tax=Streptacidiphilus sp. MAP12-16 TaxID=3156300 RepID=UPI003512A628